MRILLTLVAVVGWLTAASSQAILNSWKPVSKEAVALPESAARISEPREYGAFSLDYESLRAALADAPREFSAEAASGKFRVQIPRADGSLETFVMSQTPVAEPGLAARYPEIQTYSGYLLREPATRLRATCSPYTGFRALIHRADKGLESIEPIASGQNQYYVAYDWHDFPIDHAGLLVKAENPPGYEPGIRPYLPDPGPAERGLNDLCPVQLRIYRFAVSCTGEFAEDMCAPNPLSKATVLAKIMDITNQLNTIYEGELAIRLVLIDEEDKCIFLDKNTDPFTGESVGTWMNINPTVLNDALGTPDKFDIGHVFARYLGGDALGVSGGDCCTQFKGRGASAGNLTGVNSGTYGPNFLSTVGQEIGHAWAGGHTWSHCSANNQFSPNSACEPGSGSTIMSYAGACGTDDVQGYADLYYQACSILEMKNFIDNGTGATCGTLVSTGNNCPTAIILHPDGLFLPINTPFELKGSGVDPDNDPINYAWDEIDHGQMAALGTPTGTSPLFRSFPPGPSPNRTFPRIQVIVSNTPSKTEVLPTYNRDLTFCFVVRDNKAGGGGIGYDTILFKSTTTAGPFLVTTPNAASAVWKVGEYQSVVWDVANTTNALVNCQAVNIRLSTDGGLTYPITLASNVPNNGKHCVLVPDNVTTKARVRVEAADNVFFDISNNNFKIEAPAAPGFALCPAESKTQICLPQTYSISISTNAFLGFNELITLSATGLPSGAIATFSPNPVPAGMESVMTIDFPAGLAESVSDVTVQGTSGSATATTILTTTIISNDFSAFALTSPANGATSVEQSPTLFWNGVPDADKYEAQIATNPSFEPSTLKGANSNLAQDSFNTPTVLDKGQLYFWRVRPKNDCGFGPWSEIFVFSTVVDNCVTLSAQDVPKNISANGTPTVESKITVPSGGTISDVNIKTIQGHHSWFKDLEMHLIGPGGGDVLLFKDKCPGDFNFNFGFDDSGPSQLNCPPSNNGTALRPVDALSIFNGQSAGGDWILRIKDNAVSSGGMVTAFDLELCSSASLNAPFIVNNLTLSLNSGVNALIGNNLLKADDANNTASQLTYTLVTVPAQGYLTINGSGPAVVGAQFTQSDIDNGKLRYYDYGFGTGEDHFRFVISDGEGGFVQGVFVVQPIVGTKEAVAPLAFSLTPNPASSQVRLTLPASQPEASKVGLYDAAGRQLRTWTLEPGATELSLDLHDLPRGAYAVSVENSRTKGTSKLILQ